MLYDRVLSGPHTLKLYLQTAERDVRPRETGRDATSALGHPPVQHDGAEQRYHWLLLVLRPTVALLASAHRSGARGDRIGSPALFAEPSQPHDLVSCSSSEIWMCTSLGLQGCPWQSAGHGTDGASHAHLFMWAGPPTKQAPTPRQHLLSTISLHACDERHSTSFISLPFSRVFSSYLKITFSSASTGIQVSSDLKDDEKSTALSANTARTPMTALDARS